MWLFSALVGIALAVAAQQLPPATLTFEELIASVPAAPPAVAGQEVGAQELTVTLNAETAANQDVTSQVQGPPHPSSLTLARRRRAAGALPIERHPELSADQLVVVGVDSTGSVVSWSLVKDPRVVRAELPGPDGTLRGQVLYRGAVDLLVVLPDISQIERAAIYQPMWTGSEWQLTLIGSLALDGSR